MICQIYLSDQQSTLKTQQKTNHILHWPQKLLKTSKQQENKDSNKTRKTSVVIENELEWKIQQICYFHIKIWL